jgi:CDP-diacylglycerol--serine O-phosphatidyltransferase
MIKFLTFADVFSLINGCLGFIAIIVLFSFITNFDVIRISFSLILLALLADGLDGIIARKRQAGELGEYLEAMTDMISMGIAPSIFVFKIYYDTGSSGLFFQFAFILVLMLFIICSIIRLSSFHLMKNESYFVGIPASASTIFILIASFIGINYLYILALIIVLSFATISNIRFPKPGIKVNTIATILIIITLFMGEIFNYIAPLLLFSALAVYVLAGPFYIKKTQ